MTSNEIMLIVLVAGLAALVKSITGMGFPLVLLPILALFIDVADAVVIIAPANLVLNASLVLSTRDQRHAVPSLTRFTVPGVMGTVLGAALLPVLPETLMRVLLVGIIMLFLANHLSGRPFTLSESRSTQLSPVVGSVAGVFQGAASVAGPIVTPWFLVLGLTRDALVHALASFFALTGTIQMAVFAIRGLLNLRLLGIGLSLVPVALLVLPIGVRVRQRISLQAFQRLVLLLLAGSAVSLLARIF